MGSDRIIIKLLFEHQYWEWQHTAQCKANRSKQALAHVPARHCSSTLLSLALASKPAGHLFVDTHLVCETLQVILPRVLPSARVIPFVTYVSVPRDPCDFVTTMMWWVLVCVEPIMTSYQVSHTWCRAVRFFTLDCDFLHNSWCGMMLQVMLLLCNCN